MAYDYGRLFNDSFESGVGLGSSLKDKHRRDEITRLKKGYTSQAQAEAAASGGTNYTLDQGAGDKAVPDYQSDDKSTIDMIAGQEDFINERPGLTAQPARGASVAPATAAQGAAPATGPMTPEQFYARGETTKPKLDATDIFHKKYAPKVIQALIDQGEDDKATKFEDWSRGQQGKAYGKSYVELLDKARSGDTAGALTGMQDLYNKQTPDGRYVIVKPGKDGGYTIENRDEKTNKLMGTRTGTGAEIMQLGLGMLTPKARFDMEQKAVEDAAKKAETIETEDRKFTKDKELEEIKASNKPEVTSPLMKAMNDRQRMAEANPKDPRLATMDAYITKMKTSGGGSTVNISNKFNMSTSPQPGGAGLDTAIRVNPATGQAEAVPIAGGRNYVKEATNSLSGVTLVTPPPSADNPNPRPYLTRNGQKISAANPSTKDEYVEVQKHMATLRQNGKPMPWEQKPGLR